MSEPIDAGDLPVTFDQAERIGAYELARMWADLRLTTPIQVSPEAARAAGIAERTVEHELQELALMAALQTWLHRWTPLQIHQALLVGADVDQVVAAAGTTSAAVIERWREWSRGQRQLWSNSPGLDRTEEHDRVARKLDDYEATSADRIYAAMRDRLRAEPDALDLDDEHTPGNVDTGTYPRWTSVEPEGPTLGELEPVICHTCRAKATPEHLASPEHRAATTRETW